MIFKLAAIGLTFFLLGCVTTPPKQYIGEPLVSTPEFPFGKYVHAVDVDVPGRGNWQLQGVAHLSPEGVKLAGLSPMGTTVFKIVDDYANPVEVRVYQPELKLYESKLLDFYLQLKPHLTGRMMGLKTLPEGWKVQYFASKKTDTLPPTLTVSSPQFSVSVEVEQYEP